MFSEFSIYNFGFALVVVLLLFYVLCSKEALVRLKPISLPMQRVGSRLRRRKSARLGVDRWEESFYAPVTLGALSGGCD